MFTWLEIIGYTGSLLVAVSLSMKSIVKLRWINLFGAFTFSIYGFLIDAYPVFALNLYITIVDLFFLIKLYSRKDSFSLVRIYNYKDGLLNKFLDSYKDDILKFFPDFNEEKLQHLNCYFTIRNLFPAGLFVFEELPNKVYKIHLDYAVPEYRDLKNGIFLYSTEANFLSKQDCNSLITESNVDLHQKYLLNIGFKREENSDIFKKDICLD